MVWATASIQSIEQGEIIPRSPAVSPLKVATALFGVMSCWDNALFGTPLQLVQPSFNTHAVNKTVVVAAGLVMAHEVNMRSLNS